MKLNYWVNNKVEIVNLAGKGNKKTEKELGIIALKVVKILGKKNISVEILLTEGRLMKFLNKRFRGKNKAADVLSFEEPKEFVFPKSKNRNIGEIYINTRYKIQDTKYLLIHGLLHLFGYDHKKKSDIIKMEKVENWIVRELEN